MEQFRYLREHEDDVLECDVTITAHGEQTIVRLSIDEKENLKVHCWEDSWEEWTSYNSQVSNLWRQMFFSKENA